ncbi:hypothetical protein [Rhodoferax sediminis]|uniref:Uncharacterized protein n=1 Tax=Rhodoferax sediminis TaxID=2509614 RepID=A0A515D6Y9_9BURK|nr:hypothetical protein [Rhodoferax sediminis]QDL36185.1 hypothetical protein EUB48_01905 [Rhodoferax sediminis]
MGVRLKDHDIYVGSLQQQLNLRFAPPMGTKETFGGLEEMVALQKEFEIFKEGRRFHTSIAVLNLVGAANHETKNRFYDYLASLRGMKSNIAGQSGDVAIVKALVRNLSAKKPLPVHFALHDMNESKEANRVIVTDKARPLFYMDQDYLVISLPLGVAPVKKAK